MKKRLALFLVALIAACSLWAQDAYDLTFDENLATPAVTGKAQRDVRSHMRQVSSSLAKQFASVELLRDGEVVLVTIPASALFAANDTIVTASGRKLLGRLSSAVKAPTMYKLVVAAHSDDTGDDAYRIALTEARANAVDDCMIDASGVEDENIIPFGLGSDDPVSTNDSMAGRAKNRRIEIYIVPEAGLIERAAKGKL